jgi:single-strand DNA-binding protein
MSKGLNKVMLIGRLGSDPEIKQTGGGTLVANLSVATNHSRKNQAGEWEDETEWHRVVLFGKTAEVAQQYLRKGSQVYIEGRLQTRKWQDKEGNDRYMTEIIANEMQMLGGRSEGGEDKQQQPVAKQFSGKKAHHDGHTQAPPKGADFDDDIPF